MAPKTHGYARRSRVPALLRTTPKVCGKCDSWYAARPRETVCDGCVPPSVRTERALKTPLASDYARTAPRAGKHPGKQGVRGHVRQVYSESLNLTFLCPVKDPGAAALECRVLAYEEAARQRWKYGKTPEVPERVAA